MRFDRRPETVHAEQWFSGSLIDGVLPAFCGSPGSYVVTPSGLHWLSEGDWILTDSEGNRTVMDAASFEAAYRPAPDIPVGGGFGTMIRSKEFQEWIQREIEDNKVFIDFVNASIERQLAELYGCEGSAEEARHPRAGAVRAAGEGMSERRTLLGLPIVESDSVGSIGKLTLGAPLALSAAEKAERLIGEVAYLRDMHEGGYHEDLEAATAALRRYHEQAKRYRDPDGILRPKRCS